MKDFIGSFAGGVSKLVQTFLFPALVAVSLWAFFVFRTARRQAGSVYADIAGLDNTERLVALGGSALVLALLLGLLTPATTRLLEGYWWGRQHSTGPFLAVWNRRQERWQGGRGRIITGINELLTKAELSAAEKARLSKLYRQFKRFPVYPEPVMPTRLGNVLRAAEAFGTRTFGLDTVTMWDSLAANIPDSLRESLGTRRAHLDLFVASGIASAAFVGATLHAVVTTDVDATLLAATAAVSCVVWLVSYVGAVEVAASYADGIIAVVLLGRKPLADSLSLTIPDTLDGARDVGSSDWAHLLRR